MALDCKHCIYRASEYDHLGTCAYALITGNTRTKRGETLTNETCEQYVRQDKTHKKLRERSAIHINGGKKCR